MGPSKIRKSKTGIPEADVAERADFCDDPNGIVAFKFYESSGFHFIFHSAKVAMMALIATVPAVITQRFPAISKIIFVMIQSFLLFGPT